ncbi:MAG: response regulator transcription factor [Pseudodesulfovibrio sp.]|uniref:response regulator transcription factor n=1 Tax=Pseudodesulfovibrio sp. TaxID=2035812 RepID=UPI003D109BA3
MRILIVDDEQTLLDQLQKGLEKQRYLVETALNGEEALDKLFESPVDLVILDIMLPGVNGLEVLRALRREGDATPVLMLTAKGDIDDKIQGLDLGADDYLAKPFSFDELLARVRALLRRSGGQTESVLQAGELRLDTVSREVSRGGKPLNLTAREFSILEFFLYNKNRAVSRFSLAEHVWGDAFDPFSMSNFMDVHIKNLRKKIGDADGSLIRTIRGVGYIVKDEAP